MGTSVKVTMRMRGYYPDISSGVVYFRNVTTGAEVSIQVPNDLNSGIYSVNSIVMDSGASSTLFPPNFAERLDVNAPTENEERYYIFSGVGGGCIAFVSFDLIMIGIQDDRNKVENVVHPFFLAKSAPSITCEGKLLSLKELQPYTGKAVDFICPPLKYLDDYMVEVHSPEEDFLPLERRLKLEVNTGLDMDYILIGRDWQRWFDILFKPTEMIIMSR